MTPQEQNDAARKGKTMTEQDPLSSSPTSEGRDVTCEHGTAMDVHCCNCHSGFLFDSARCVCALDDRLSERRRTVRQTIESLRVGGWLEPADAEAILATLPTESSPSEGRDPWQDLQDVFRERGVNGEMQVFVERGEADVCHRASVSKAVATLRASLAEAQAEIERLKADAEAFHMDYRMKCDVETKALHVEVERLRAALQAVELLLPNVGGAQ